MSGFAVRRSDQTDQSDQTEYLRVAATARLIQCNRLSMTDVLASLASPSSIGLAVFLGVLIVCYRITLPVYLKFKRRKEGCGTVFRSDTGEPVDLARIRLADMHGITVTTAVTDKQGHYRLVVFPGEYVMDVTKEGFVFPSKYLSSAERSVTYDNVIPSSRVRIKDHGIVTKNIPVDPIRPAHARSKVFRRRIILGENAQLLIAWTTPWAAFAVPLFAGMSGIPLALSWGSAAVYAAAMGRRFITFKPGRGAYGTIADAHTGVPLDRVVVRLFDAKFNKQLQTLTTTEKGRYAFLVNAGSYYILMKHDGYRPVRLNFPNITKESYPLATDVRMKRNLIREGEAGDPTGAAPTGDPGA
jgi:hypothetical protein